MNMKKIVHVFMILTMSLALLGCKDKANEANTTDAKPSMNANAVANAYMVDVVESRIEWKGFKPTGTHNGTIKIEKGVINTNQENVIMSGNFVIDMTSIDSHDLQGEKKLNLESHLKGTVEGKEGDFFNVNEFPDATFEITNLEAVENGNYNLSGNLTLKGVKNNITIPVKTLMESNSLVLTSAPFTIDRTKWGVNYGSKSVFDNLGDAFINDEIELNIMVKANKR